LQQAVTSAAEAAAQAFWARHPVPRWSNSGERRRLCLCGSQKPVSQGTRCNQIGL